MKIVINILTLFMCFNSVIFSQEQKPEFIDGKEIFQLLFSNVKMDVSGNLCATIKDENEMGRYLIFTDDNKEPK